MSFKPKQTEHSQGDYEPRNQPTPKDGNRKARVSLIVDLGEQEREDYEDPKTKETRPQKPCQQVAVFADLVNDVVDYGGKIGKQQYRLALHKTFKGVPIGINFQAVAPRDADGNLMSGKPYQLHPANLLTKLAKATEQEEIIYEDRKNPKSLDISLLLDKPFMCQVEVKKTKHKEGKKDADGNVIVYTNVNFRGATPVPLDDDDKPLKVAELTQEARCVTFDNATKEDIQFIRPSLIKYIKKANNYEGSVMQEAIEAYESEQGNSDDDESDDGESEQEEEKEEKKPVKTAKPAKPAKPTKPAARKKAESTGEDDDDEDVPF